MGKIKILSSTTTDKTISGSTCVISPIVCGTSCLAGTTLNLAYSSASNDAIRITNTNTGGNVWYIGDGAGAGAGQLGFYNNTTACHVMCLTNGGGLVTPNFIQTGAVVSSNGVSILEGRDLSILAAAGSGDSGDIVFYSGESYSCETARIWTDANNGCLYYRSLNAGLGNTYCFYHSGNIGIATVGIACCVASGTITDLNTAWCCSCPSNALTLNNYALSATNKPATVDNANWLLNIYSHGSGGVASYGHQLAGADSENIYFRFVTNGTLGNWRCLYHSGNLPATGSALSGLSDVTISGPATGDILTYTGVSGWANCTPVDITSNLSTGDALCYNGSTITGFTAMPVGAILPFAGSTAPAGYLIANGAAVNRTGIYAALFAVIGTTYGTGNGSTTFNIPDLRGIFMKGCGTSGKLCNANAAAFTGTLGGYCNDMYQGHKHYITSSGGHCHQCYDNVFCTGWWTAMNSCSGWAAGRFCQALGIYCTGLHCHTNGDFSATQYTDGSNGDPRIGADTHPASLTINYIIKY